MKRAKSTLAAIIVCCTALVVGCSPFAEKSSNQETQPIVKNETRENSQPPIPTQTPENPPQKNAAEEMPKFEVTPSAKIPGWNKLKAKLPLGEMEVSNHGVAWTGSAENSSAAFTLDFPSSWFINSSVFADKDNNKVGELVPFVALASKDLAEQFKDYQPLEGELIKKEFFDISEYKGLKLIEQVPVAEEGGSAWYAYSYFISDNQHIATIVFYATDLNEAKQKLFEEIISTISFE